MLPAFQTTYCTTRKKSSMSNYPSIKETELATFFRLVEAKYQVLVTSVENGNSEDEPGNWYDFYASETLEFFKKLHNKESEA